MRAANDCGAMIVVTSEMTIAALLTEYLRQAGVRHVFGYPGESIVDFMEATRSAADPDGAVLDASAHRSRPAVRAGHQAGRAPGAAVGGHRNPPSPADGHRRATWGRASNSHPRFIQERSDRSGCGPEGSAAYPG